MKNVKIKVPKKDRNMSWYSFFTILELMQSYNLFAIKRSLSGYLFGNDNFNQNKILALWIFSKVSISR